jgi:hypothetical protein
MELIFNELTCQPYAKDFTDCYSRVEQFVKTYRASECHGFSRIRFQLAFDQIFLEDGYTLNDFVQDPRVRTFATIMFSIYRHPFIDDATKEEDQYIQNDFSILKEGNKLRVHGLAAAYLYQTIGIGFCSEPFWEMLLFSLQIEGSEEGCAEILAVSMPQHFENNVFLKWKEQNAEIRLIECEIPVASKRISLRNDHGKDVLQKFAERLVYSPYVVEILNSLPYNQHENKFIRNVKPGGLVEIVLTNTDEGFGLVVKTTGRNHRETEAIAKILDDCYS